MEVSIEQLKAVNIKDLKIPYYRLMLESTIKYVEEQAGKAWVHPHILADFGIEI
ncbi:hypothetical protein [Neobacillus sp.]|uniref:hypothetical protein n=1 Tax=Neobacillus sp. TaxID=2675273 RepID=UPI0035B52470